MCPDQPLASLQGGRDCSVQLGSVVVSSVAVAGQELTQLPIEALQAWAKFFGAPDRFRHRLRMNSRSFRKRRVSKSCGLPFVESADRVLASIG